MKGCFKDAWGRCPKCRRCHHCWITDVYRSSGQGDPFHAWDGLIVRQCAHCACIPAALADEDPKPIGTPAGAAASRAAHEEFHEDGNDHRWAQRQRTHRSTSLGRRQWNG